MADEIARVQQYEYRQVILLFDKLSFLNTSIMQVINGASEYFLVYYWSEFRQQFFCHQMMKSIYLAFYQDKLWLLSYFQFCCLRTATSYFKWISILLTDAEEMSPQARLCRWLKLYFLVWRWAINISGQKLNCLTRKK